METTIKTKKKSKIDAEPKFSVGDTLKVTKSIQHPLRNGSKGVVERIAKSESERCYFMRFGMSTDWIYEKQLKKV